MLQDTHLYPLQYAKKRTSKFLWLP